MGPCLCGDTACPSCNPGGAEAEAHAEAVAERVVARLGRLQLHRALVIVDPDGAHDPDAPESGPLAPGQPLTEALELIPARDVPPELGRGATTDNARELLTEAVIELVIELESEAYLKGGRDTLDAQAEAKALADLERLEDPPEDPIAALLDHLADEARAIPQGAAFHGGPLAGASRYNVATAMIRKIVAWDHHRKGPVGADCSACGAVRACSPQGAAGYPLCLACYELAVLEAADPAPPKGEDEDPEAAAHRRAVRRHLGAQGLGIRVVVDPGIPEGTAILVGASGHTFAPSADGDGGTCDLCGKAPADHAPIEGDPDATLGRLGHADLADRIHARAAVCPNCHHRPEDRDHTLGELSPGRYGDEEGATPIRCYCDCHDAPAETDDDCDGEGLGEPCEGCKAPAVTRDTDGIPLCGACYDALDVADDVASETGPVASSGPDDDCDDDPDTWDEYGDGGGAPELPEVAWEAEYRIGTYSGTIAFRAAELGREHLIARAKAALVRRSGGVGLPPGSESWTFRRGEG